MGGYQERAASELAPVIGGRHGVACPRCAGHQREGHGTATAHPSAAHGRAPVLVVLVVVTSPPVGQWHACAGGWAAAGRCDSLTCWSCPRCATAAGQGQRATDLDRPPGRATVPTSPPWPLRYQAAQRPHNSPGRTVRQPRQPRAYPPTPPLAAMPTGAPTSMPPQALASAQRATRAAVRCDPLRVVHGQSVNVGGLVPPTVVVGDSCAFLPSLW